MRFTYHYCATVQTSAGSINYLDGIAQMSSRIEDMNDYTAFKLIVSGSHPDHPMDWSYDPKKLTISSLSLLNAEP